jgi:hypothetical protein
MNWQGVLWFCVFLWSFVIAAVAVFVAAGVIWCSRVSGCVPVSKACLSKSVPERQISP